MKVDFRTLARLCVNGKAGEISAWAEQATSILGCYTLHLTALVQDHVYTVEGSGGGTALQAGRRCPEAVTTFDI